MKLRLSKRFHYCGNVTSDAEGSENILIKGDNNDVLPELRSAFAGRIKCIYIDPPYNNGETYYYYNDNAVHDSWLAGMGKVLGLLKPLLTEDGSIWISIDDREMAYLKVEADKIFGRENFAATIIWQQRKTRENRALFSCNHEYVLVYAKNLARFRKSRNMLPVATDFISKKYKNPDNDPRGPWQSVSANVQAGHAVASQFYAIMSPSGVRHVPPKGRCWIYNEERMKREISQGNVWFGRDGTGVPRIKKFLNQAKIGLTPETIWLADEAGTTDNAKKQLKEMFPEERNVFDTPKPEELLKLIIEIASNEGDYVLDCFLGSGTTMAVAHKMKRRYVGIESGDQMSKLVVKRMNLVINGEQSGISKLVNWSGGGAFGFYCFKEAGVASEAEMRALSKSSTPYPVLYGKLEQMRLAIEKRKKYTGMAAGKARAAKKAAKKKVAKKSAVKHPKSVKARYGKH